jgi:hypothetical protein
VRSRRTGEEKFRRREIAGEEKFRRRATAGEEQANGGGQTNG